MFNWTTTTFINELPHIAIEKGGRALRIGNKLFEKRWVESIRRAEGHNYELCEAQVDLTDLAALLKDYNVARLYIYVGLEGSEESIYANDWYRKGMPLSVSFPVSKYEVSSDDAETQANKEAAAADMAKAIVDTVKDFNVFTKVKKVLDVTAEDGVVTIKGTHEHQRLQRIAILVEDTDSVLHEEKVITEYIRNRKETATGITPVKVGVNGFGTYSQLTKDLSLPTAAHTHWTSVTKDERPIVGALYTQYIISYYAPSTANPSFTAVGNRSMSETTHVFWVKSDLVSAWETWLANIDPDGDSTPAILDQDGKVTTPAMPKLDTEVDGKAGVNKKKSLIERVEALEA